MNRKQLCVDLESEARKSLLSSETFTLENTERTDGRIDIKVAEMDIDSHMYRNYGNGETSTESEHEFEQEDDEVRSCHLYANNDRERSAALLLLTVKERFKPTQPVIDFITQQMHNIISYGVDDIQKVVQEWLENQGIEANFAELATRLESFCIYRNRIYAVALLGSF